MSIQVERTDTIPGQLEGTDTMFFIDKQDTPTACWRDVTYGRVVANYRPENQDPNRTRLTVVRYRVNYSGYCGTPTVNILTINLLLISIVSTPVAKFINIDIKIFYLNTPMECSKYMIMKPSDLPADLVKH